MTDTLAAIAWGALAIVAALALLLTAIVLDVWRDWRRARDRAAAARDAGRTLEFTGGEWP